MTDTTPRVEQRHRDLLCRIDDMYASYMGDPDGNDDIHTAREEAARVIAQFEADHLAQHRQTVQSGGEVADSDIEFLRDLAARLFKYGAPAFGFDQGDTDRLYGLARRLAAPAAPPPSGETVMKGEHPATDALCDLNMAAAIQVLCESSLFRTRAGRRFEQRIVRLCRDHMQLQLRAYDRGMHP